MKKIILMCTIACMGSLMAKVQKDNSISGGQNLPKSVDVFENKVNEKERKKMVKNNAHKALYGRMSNDEFDEHIKNASREEIDVMKEELATNGKEAFQKQKDRFVKKTTVQDADLGLGGLFEEPATETIDPSVKSDEQNTFEAMRKANELAAQQRTKATERRAKERKVREDTNFISEEFASKKPQRAPVRRERAEETRVEPEIKSDEKPLTAELSALEGKIEQIRRRIRAVEEKAAKFDAVEKAVSEENKEDRRAVRD